MGVMLLLSWLLDSMVVLAVSAGAQEDSFPATGTADIHHQLEQDHQQPQPEFLNTPTHVTVKVGALAILPCWVRYLGDRQVAWRSLHDDTFLTIGKATWVQDSNLVLEHLRKEDGVTSWDLIIRQARVDQAGDYECQVTSQFKLARTVTLTVIDEPTYNSQVIVPTGEMIHLVCNVSANNVSNFDLHWHKNGQRIDSGSYPYIVITRYQVQSTRMFVTDLIIDNVSLDDSGIYTCRSSSRKVLDTTKVTVVRSDPSNNKRDETRKNQDPDAADEQQEEDSSLEERSSYFSTDKLRTQKEVDHVSRGGLSSPGCWLAMCSLLLSLVLMLGCR